MFAVVYQHPKENFAAPRLAAVIVLTIELMAVGKLIELESRFVTQLHPLAREIRLFGVGLRADGHIFARGHRHRASHQSRDTRD